MSNFKIDITCFQKNVTKVITNANIVHKSPSKRSLWFVDHKQYVHGTFIYRSKVLLIFHLFTEVRALYFKSQYIIKKKFITSVELPFIIDKFVGIDFVLDGCRIFPAVDEVYYSTVGILRSSK